MWKSICGVNTQERSFLERISERVSGIFQPCNETVVDLGYRYTQFHLEFYVDEKSIPCVRIFGQLKLGPWQLPWREVINAALDGTPVQNMNKLPGIYSMMIPLLDEGDTGTNGTDELRSIPHVSILRLEGVLVQDGIPNDANDSSHTHTPTTNMRFVSNTDFSPSLCEPAMMWRFSENGGSQSCSVPRTHIQTHGSATYCMKIVRVGEVEPCLLSFDSENPRTETLQIDGMPSLL